MSSGHEAFNFIMSLAMLKGMRQISFACLVQLRRGTITLLGSRTGETCALHIRMLE